MYIQIVDYCNMSCKHCGMSCKHKGSTMSLETFRNALKEGDESITIGGGEPTLHPHFWQFLMEAVARSESVWLATNGSQTEIAIALAGLAKKGVVGVALSQDIYHDEIDYKVVEAFTKDKKPYNIDRDNNDLREIRNVEGKLIKAGRCKEGLEECICSDLFIEPSGKIRGCGCVKSPVFGNVNTTYKIPNDWDIGECYKIQYVERCTHIKCA